jgi:hypothetical protein
MKEVGASHPSSLDNRSEAGGLDARGETELARAVRESE